MLCKYGLYMYSLWFYPTGTPANFHTQIMWQCTSNGTEAKISDALHKKNNNICSPNVIIPMLCDVILVLPFKFVEDIKGYLYIDDGPTMQWLKENEQTMTYKTLHRKSNIEQYEPNKKT